MNRKTLSNLNMIPLLSIAFLFLTTTAYAQTIYVNVNNTSGFEEGSLEYPFNTITEGLEVSAAGDVVSVAPGIYYGSIELVTDVKLVSQEGPIVTVIDGMGADTAVLMPYSPGPRGYIDGFTVQNASKLFWATNRVNFWGGNSLEIHNSILQDGGSAVQAYPASKVTITRSVISVGSYAIYAIWCSAPTLTNVTLDAGNDDYALFAYQTSYNLYNTTISNMKYILGVGRSGSLNGSNNNFWNYEDIFLPFHTNYYASDNMTNTISVDPMFVDPPNDYRLQAGSLLIDAGIDVGYPYVGTAPDIGANEYDDMSISDLLELLMESYQEVPLDTFKNAAEQRLHALQNKLFAVIAKIEGITEEMTADEKISILESARNKLVHDIQAKGDGFFGGNPKNDWIVTLEEQERLNAKIQELLEAIDADIVELVGEV